MSDNDLQSVIQQYYDAPISSRMLPSMVLPGSAPATIYKDQVEAVVARICRHGALDGAETDSTVIYILLPRGVVLVDGFSPGFRPLPGQEAEHKRRQHAVVKVGDQDADSRHGLGGYHGSARVTPCGTAYYAVGVYSEAGNGIPIFNQPWKNVAATIYHQLNEARTDPTWTTPPGPATAPGSAGTPPRAARSATSRSRKPAPASPSFSVKSTWPTARVPSRSSSCGPTRPKPPPHASPSPRRAASVDRRRTGRASLNSSFAG